jgi:hypothetical protein
MMAENANALHYFRILKQCEFEVKTSQLKLSNRKALRDQISRNLDTLIGSHNDVDQQCISEMEKLYEMLKELCACSRRDYT